MTKELPDNIQKDLEKACTLHQRATSDYQKCIEFNKLTSDLLARIEDAGHYRLADRVMTILLDCNTKEASSCEKATITGERVKKFCKS
ncbi:MAG: hypothetical protein OEL85_08150 [Desulfobulbaceae bacterium]|nr:hypothetical protein [Desulfobulbaceae bacterium]